MTLPNLYPTGYTGTSADFLKCKVDRSGALREITGVVTVTNGSATGTIVGLAPFQKGAKLNYGSRVIVSDIDTASAVTIDIGVIYDDNATTTSIPDAYVTASTAGQAGGAIEMTSATGAAYTTSANGWIAATIKTANPVTGTMTFNLGIAYDTSGVTN